MGIQQGDQAGPATPSRSIDPLVQKFGQLNVLDDLIRLRAADVIQYPILAYPTSKNDATNYDYYSGQDLDEMIDQRVSTLIEDGFRPSQRDGCIVAILALSDLHMVVTFFALTRLGYTVMMLSPRLSGEACASLLEEVGCESIIYGNTAAIRTTMGHIIQRKPMVCRPMPVHFEEKSEDSLLVLHRSRNSAKQRSKVALVLHSSGSTGTPKPLYLTHQALMTHPLRGPGLTSFNPLPWYHLHGLSTALQAMWMRKTAFMWNAELPLTADSVISVLEASRPESVAAVPYMLQILADNPRGIAALRKCKIVTYGGAPCPDELGDHLVREGIPFAGSFGLTEAGLVAESISRPEGDPYWNYLKFFDNIQPYIWMKPIGDSLYECVYLSGHPALTTSNSNEPPGSFHSKDVFTPHPTIPNRWKYASRLDDRITLVNGEKVLPLPIEGRIKQHTLIHDAVVVGIGQAVPGLLVFQTQHAQNMYPSEEEYMDEIWEAINAANSCAENFSQISRDMIAVLPYDSPVPRTDKGSMIRAQVYQQYAELIESIYDRDEKSEGDIQLSTDETETLLMQLCQDHLGISLSSPEANFFSEGVDSLKAIHLRRLILQNFQMPTDLFPRNAVYEAGSVSKLAEQICALQSGEDLITEEDQISAMAELIQKYSTFQQHIPHDVPASNQATILTGATGSIGSHTLHELLNDDSVSTIFCLTRQESPFEAILSGLIEKELYITSEEQVTKIVALTAHLDQPDFGLDQTIMTHMRSSVTQILHVAWPVDFNLTFTQFEPHIKALHNLIQFSLSVHQPQPATVMFCSSVSTALGANFSEITEGPMALDTAYMGYGRSKLTGEHIISAARQTGARTYSLRIGQVSGHSKKGLWNDTESLPLMIRSALTLKALPDLQESCSWLPVDKMAAIMLELMRTCSASTKETSNGIPCLEITEKFEDDSVYNVCNSRVFSWSTLLESLARNGFQFEVVPFEKWLDLLRESEAKGEEYTNPAIKLIDHYEAMYGAKSSSLLTPKTFVVEKAERDSLTLRNGRLRIIEDGILDCYVRDWVSRWMRS
ncbi:AMP-dependent synthetase/ligase [Penicillium malachiteum]|uniref:AMP-dependent synthetase/ligase n=1 Tax=Penicillium malachiteum TaxID=1324776 RepID=UPI0025472420|nr:AMP-dependent synthetase/ligase [Penicillium malachiteum]KAJ5720661.1 AMP-dependent synthetase/ligase [Penicillium malachiteum]